MPEYYSHLVKSRDIPSIQDRGCVLQDPVCFVVPHNFFKGFLIQMLDDDGQNSIFTVYILFVSRKQTLIKRKRPTKSLTFRVSFVIELSIYLGWSLRRCAPHAK